MRALLILPLLATPAAAHVGHLGPLAGHDHIALGAGIAVIVGGAVVAWVRGGRRKDAPEADADAASDAASEDASA